MIIFLKRAIKDIFSNKFLNIVTITTIALSVIILSSFAIFFINVSDMMSSWKKGLRIIAYLKPDVSRSFIPDIKLKIEEMNGVRSVGFISKEEALSLMKKQMKRQASLLENLKENPLPDAFEIHMIPSSSNWDTIEPLSLMIESLDSVEDVEYGQKWFGRVASILNVFRFACYAIGCLFFAASVFIVANTSRLVFYLRREEIEIMRLVGATDTFIKVPFYIESVIQGILGGITGIVIFYLLYVFVISSIAADFASGFISIRFLSLKVCCIIIFCSIFAGWLGCFVSLKRFQKI